MFIILKKLSHAYSWSSHTYIHTSQTKSPPICFQSLEVTSSRNFTSYDGSLLCLLSPTCLIFSSSFKLYYVSFHLLLNSISLYIHTILCLATYQLMDIWIVSNFLAIMNIIFRNIHVQKMLYEYILSFLLCSYLKVKLLSHPTNLYLTLESGFTIIQSHQQYINS